ncbi:DUF1048 domain-containing protein [Leucobacter allii]|uniref:DUF1048 domain-containing protein n=1 Tax=Leucobacter allii TaxID=2932247 RepID=UPI001FD2BFDA|nr:DUF1048 domain-containing protein [Leucobacter allii]UOR00855.1 DUF1048 domain-containing protein [Leucobacter allii]
MAAKWIEALTGSLEQKREYKQQMARLEALPAPYAEAARALNRYFMYYGAIADGETLVTMLGDHVELWERAAVDGTPVSTIVGDDPVGFAETFVSSYRHREWIDKERQRLVTAIGSAIEQERGRES